VLADPWWRGEAVLAHARQFFPDVGVAAGAGAAPSASGPVWGTAEGPRPVPERATESTRRYLAYVLLDVVTVDPDLDEEEAVRRALAHARAAGLAAAFEAVARAELGLSAAAWRRLAGEVRA
jgi:hypothetical protein